MKKSKTTKLKGWLCIPYTYSQGPEAGFSPTYSKEILSSELLKKKSTLEKFSCNGNLMDCFPSFLFGMMLQHSDTTIPTRLNTWDSLNPSEMTSVSREVFPVRTFLSPEKEQELKESVLVSGMNTLEYSGRYVRDTHSLKIVRCSGQKGSKKSSPTLPRWGMMRSGVLFQLPTPEPITKGNECGSGRNYPTPTCADAAQGSILNDKSNIYFLKSGMPRKVSNNGVDGSIGLSRFVKIMWPTPSAVPRGAHTGKYSGSVSADGKSRTSAKGTKFGATLQTAVKMFPTPSVCGNHNRKGASKTSGDGLSTVVKRWPTPCTRDYKGPSGKGFLKRKNNQISGLCDAVKMFPTPRANERGEKSLPPSRINDVGKCTLSQAMHHKDYIDGETPKGSLNPDWTELLMGWPKGWTSQDPLDSIKGWDTNLYADNWEQDTPRVTEGTPNRASRLKAIGNGQVPQCAVLAWNLLKTISRGTK